MSRANYQVVETTPEAVVLRDIGPWNKFMTITNAAEEVVEELADRGILKDGQRLFYYDSENELTELVHKDGQFMTFAPA
jgi:hypothetical protein